MKRTMLVMALFTLLVAPAAAAEIDVPAVAGTWMSPEGTYALEISPCEEKLCGTIVWAEDASLVGTVVLTDLAMQENGKGHHVDGQIADPETGKTLYRCELGVDDEGRLKLEGQIGVPRRGRVVLSRFSTTLHFDRAEALPGN